MIGAEFDPQSQSALSNSNRGRCRRGWRTSIMSRLTARGSRGCVVSTFVRQMTAMRVGQSNWHEIVRSSAYNERPTPLQQSLFSFFYLAAPTISTMAQAQYETVLDEMALAVERESHTTYLRH